VTYREFQEESLKEYLNGLLENRSMAEAAKEAGISRTYIYRLMNRAGLPVRQRTSWKLQGL
jgi:DNA-binding phage protein